MLNQQYIDHTSKGKEIQLTPEQRAIELADLKRRLND
jgi:hypothetical protein